jgi:hypothetical protein
MTDQELIAHQKSELARAEYVVRLQMTEIDRLRAEVDRLLGWINGDADALTTLQSVYLDPKESVGHRVKAAASALPFERPKVSVSVNLGPALLGQRLDQMKVIEPTTIEHSASR